MRKAGLKTQLFGVRRYYPSFLQFFRSLKWNIRAASSIKVPAHSIFFQQLCSKYVRIKNFYTLNIQISILFNLRDLQLNVIVYVPEILIEGKLTPMFECCLNE